MSWNVGQVVNLTVNADEDDTRLDRWLKRKFHGLTQGQVEKACRTGEIRVDGARAKANTRVNAGQSVRVPPMLEGLKDARAAMKSFTEQVEVHKMFRPAAARRFRRRSPP